MSPRAAQHLVPERKQGAVFGRHQAERAGPLSRCGDQAADHRSFGQERLDMLPSVGAQIVRLEQARPHEIDRTVGIALTKQVIAPRDGDRAPAPFEQAVKLAQMNLGQLLVGGDGRNLPT